ncbi:zinc ribbon domain-containing protein [Paenibacillus popilliae]|uniref:zinc ribbon domain-containing protein n=1 Tax=Paenibacillus popilliae TaxID=78057 RepID=UPI0005A8FB70|nr:zinc ribbon domain-containing protein [Paenibacillus popilliae]
MDKMKHGLHQVKEKAQQTVEVTRISSQIAGKKKEKTAQFTLLGELVHEAYVKQELTEQMHHIGSLSQAIQRLVGEITALEKQLLQAKGEKICACGAVITQVSRFCNHCGQAVPMEPTEIIPASRVRRGDFPIAVNCPQCGALLNGKSENCVLCGEPAK